MATLDEAYLGMEVQQDLCRILPNIHELIATWRAQLAGGDASIGPSMTAAARSFLGRLRRIVDFATSETATFDAAIAPLGVTRTHLNGRVIAIRDALRMFRDATKDTDTQIAAALNFLEAAIPAQKRFLSRPLPVDW